MENNYTEKMNNVENAVSVFPTNAEPHAPKAAYCEAPVEGANADILNGAATLNVFDCDYAIKIDYIHAFTEDSTAAKVEVVDYFGKVLNCANIEKTADADVWQVSFAFEKHPTGYFTVRVNGEVVDFYVVVPALKDRWVKDSPFAMDTALMHLLQGKDPALYGHYSAAMRMVGVNWVRERLQWKDYQIEKNEDGSFTYDEDYLNDVKAKLDVIKGAGLNVLMTYSTGPKWAVANARSLPGSEISKGDRPNTLATYDTQLAIYEGTKRIVEKLDKQMDVIELINEPDHPAFRDLAEHYAGWFKSAALGIIDSEAENVKISITGLCANPNGYAFIPIMMASDVMKYCTVYNYHTHIYNHDFSNPDMVPDFGNNPVARELFALRELYGIKYPSWISESGMKIPQTLPTEEQKAIQTPYAVTGAVQALSFGNNKYFWFVVAPYSEEGGDFSTFSGQNKPYPVIAVYAVMSNVLGEAKYMGELKDLPSDNARGYLFNTGKGIVSTVWMATGKASYKVAPDAKVIDMMGQEITPVNGEIEISVNPVYITYTSAPADYFVKTFEAPKPMENPAMSGADYVIITPEFEGFTFSRDTKNIGHCIADGTVIKVRVVNHGNEAVSGKVDVTIPEFTVTGLDQEITVQPHSEEFITISLNKTGESDVADIVKFTGVFNGQACSPTAVSVYSGEQQPDRKISRSGWNISFGTKMNDASNVLKSVKVTMNNFKGDQSNIIMVVDAKKFENFTYDKETSLLDMDFSSLSDGKHVAYAGFTTPGGDVRVLSLVIRYDKNTDTVTFANKY